MRALIQRVSGASIRVDGVPGASMSGGLVLLLCVERGDTDSNLEYVLRKVISLRVFDDADGRMNLSLRDVDGSLLVVSQFTLASDCRKGNRPSFDMAAPPEAANALYERFIERVQQEGIQTFSGVFGAHMQVTLTNDGPVTFMIESRG
ncbi:MAG: D-tyrosyl-tRNA(Tyr) deacylase [Magnetococcales bacterium]|uniref:D-aminoacyl-tRNA deacylase n=1 Tax=Candidatus Magnetobacterium casense TaxID=1455061 RepID=A0ABS6S2N5_9BACT|nr:D-aminoacyl-tRNA deacylase [Candidatus Magnetobacterium casensis]MBF0608324.1 D-tyrosyl-tRNA(Tyr) deacylase [Nitrospirota bacterium]MBV6343110.1 D-tyrosyl-tRNA(Tyr) deacylase [Candidatus Magnetobacterium casensis]